MASKADWERRKFYQQLHGGELEDADGYQKEWRGSGTFVTEYIYKTHDGKPYHKVARYKDPKTFRQYHWTGNSWDSGKPLSGVFLPYLLPELLAADRSAAVYICEGEKDAERLRSLGLLSTTAPGGALKWDSDQSIWLKGRSQVFVLADNDEKGRQHAEKTANSLVDVVDDVRIVSFGEMGPGEDVSDWLDDGHTKDDLIARAAKSPLFNSQKIEATRYVLDDPRSLPTRRWLYRPHYIGSYLSLTVAGGGTGKSSLAMVEALAMVTGRNLLGVFPARKLTVWYTNLEDPMEELRRRFAAAAKQYQVVPDEIGGRLYVNSGRSTPVVVAREGQKGELLREERAIAEIIKSIEENHIDVLILDPFVASHRVSENDNNKIDQVSRIWTSIAERTGCAVMAVHHSRKAQGHGQGATVDDARGASALLNAARSARVISTMTQAEAGTLGIPEAERRRYFKSELGKANLARPPDAAEWFKMETVDLENAPDPMWDESDKVGVVVRALLSDQKRVELSSIDVIQIQSAVADGRWRASERSKIEPWVGIAVARVLQLDPDAKHHRARLNKQVVWLLAERYLEVIAAKDRNGDTRDYVRPGVRIPQSADRGTEK